MKASPSEGKGSRQMSDSKTAGRISAMGARAPLPEEEEESVRGGVGEESASAGVWEEEGEDDGGGEAGDGVGPQTGEREAGSVCPWGLTPSFRLTPDPPSGSWSAVWSAEEGAPADEGTPAGAKYTTNEDLRRRCSAFLLESPIMFAGTAAGVPSEKSAAPTPDVNTSSSHASTAAPTSTASVFIVRCPAAHNQRRGWM